MATEHGSIAAADLNVSWSAGLGGLLTEDTLRFAVLKALVAQGVPVSWLQTEWRRPGGQSPRVRVRNAPTVSSRLEQIRETSDLEIPVPPIASTRSSTLRVLTPWT